MECVLERTAEIPCNFALAGQSAGLERLSDVPKATLLVGLLILISFYLGNYDEIASPRVMLPTQSLCPFDYWVKWWSSSSYGSL